MPTQERVRSLFDYKDGQLIAKQTHGQRKAGQRVGCLDTSPRKGYFRTSVDYKLHSVHRLIWIYHNGPIPPDKVIDHIDRVRTNNLISNLRMVTPLENRKNTVYKSYARINSSQGFARVGKNTNTNTFYVRCYVGSFQSLELAEKARDDFNAKLAA